MKKEKVYIRRISWVILMVGVTSMLFGQQTTDFRISHGPYLQEVTSRGASFIFTTSHAAFSCIELQKDNSAESKRYYHTEYGLHDANNTFHSIRIEKMDPDAVYKYRICTKKILDFQPYKIVFGDSIFSQWYTFQTLDPKRKGGSLFVTSDIHNDSKKLKRLLNLCDYETCNAFLYAGDVMSYMENDETPFKAFIDASVELFATSIPFEMVRGNHETRGKMARTYPKLFPKKSGKIYESYLLGDMMIVMLDSGEDKPDKTPVYAGLTDFDTYRSEQAEWLKKLVESKEFKRAKYRIVISHFPMVDTSMETLGSHGINDLINKLRPILNRAKIDLMISGHTHEYAYHSSGSAGNDFPIIVGSDRSATRLDISNGKIKAKVVETTGKILLEKTFGR